MAGYQGAEVAIGVSIGYRDFSTWFVVFTYFDFLHQGWIVTFLREDLGGTDAIGYAATGFWLGIAAGKHKGGALGMTAIPLLKGLTHILHCPGRVVLPRFSLLVGERRVVFLYILLSLGLEFVVWFSRNLYAAAICTAFIGFFIGVGRHVTLAFGYSFRH